MRTHILRVASLLAACAAMHVIQSPNQSLLTKFGLLCSNYDDKEKKTTGGRNGYGAKLANIFSTEFTIETADGARSGADVCQRRVR